MSKIYYHGTCPRFLYSIMTQGFKLDEHMHGRVHGDGTYIATKPESAAHWAGQGYVHRGNYALKVRLQPSTRILWKERNYDKKIIRQLERRFSKQISQNYDFWKYIPHNKQLTGAELRALTSHLDVFEVSMGWKRKRYKFSDKKWKHLNRFCRLLRQYGYDAVGDRTEDCWDSDEILIFNPSRVIPVSAHKLDIEWDRDQWDPIKVDYSHPLPLDEVKKISEDEQQDWNRWLAEDAARNVAEIEEN